MAAHQVRALLMGGQACVFYGAAQFSKDIDFTISAEPANWERLMNALQELQAESVAVPPCDPKLLPRGFALHFRCQHPEAKGLRVDVMSVIRGVDDFDQLWDRRVTIKDDDGTVIELLSLPDLVFAKKTQRGKDWPMIERLVEADYLMGRAAPNPAQLRFWLLELRTPALLAEMAANHPDLCARLAVERPLLALAAAGKMDEMRAALAEEQRREGEKDRLYWLPIKQELERIRHQRQATGDE